LTGCLWTEAVATTELGDYDTALSLLAEGLALSEKNGDDAFITRYLNTLGWLRIESGDFAEGIALSERSYEITGRSSRAGHGTGAERRAFIRNNEADAFMGRDDLSAAAEALDEAVHVVQHPPPSRWLTWRYAIHCYASLGQLALLRGDADQARRFAEQSLEISTETTSRKFESWAWRIKGESATMRHAWSEADESLRRALTIAEDIRQPRHTWLTHLALGRLRAAQGRRDDAHQSFRAAWAIVTALRAKTRDPGLRAGLESAPLIRELEGLARD
jgi:tetratricopeptide (TPR) repeat protein